MPDPANRTLGFVQLRTGETPLVVQRTASEGESTPSGVIYTTHNQPSLEQLLQENEVLAVYFDPPPAAEVALQSTPGVADSVHPAAPGVGEVSTQLYLRRSVAVVGCAAASGAISAAGAVLLAASIVSGHVRTNPMVALMMLLGGLVLVATVGAAAGYAAANDPGTP